MSDAFEQARKRDAALLRHLRQVKRHFDTDFAVLIIQCDDGSYHQTCLANEHSTYAEEHSIVADAVCKAIDYATGAVAHVVHDARKPE